MPEPVASCRAWPVADLIPRGAFFDNAQRLAPTISPNGQHLAFMAPYNGVQNVWIAPVDAVDSATPLTSTAGRPINDFIWSPDSSHILFRKDENGTEDFHLFGVPLSGGEPTDYTPFEGVSVTVSRVSAKVPDAILIALNDRDARWHDVHRLDFLTGELTLVWKNPGGYSRIIADPMLKPALARQILPGGGSSYHRFEEDGSLTPLFEIGLEDSLSTQILSAGSDGQVDLLDSRGRNTSVYAKMDIRSGQTTVIAQDQSVDIGGWIRDPATGAVLAYAVDYLVRRWIGLDARSAQDIAFIDQELRGPWLVTSQSDDNRYWTLSVERSAQPTTFFLYDRKSCSIGRLFSARPALEARPLAPMHAKEIPTRDGLKLVSYLSLPPGSDADGDGVPDHPLPMILNVHGGPWGREIFAFDPYHQWLANRGYAVLSLNFRASTGFGKAFINAGDGEWGRKMQYDVLDAAEWAVEQGITSADAICIFGGSYGGYAVLVGLATTPEFFRCGVEIVGVSNLLTFMETVPAYWGAIYEQFAHRMGDPRTEEGRALLKERSPVHHAHAIKRPLLIGHGANDPRVHQRESDQIVDAMRENGIPVTYVLYPDEGHGFRRPENNQSFNAVTEGFLASCLGGAFEPIVNDFDQSSIQVLEGVEHVDGLSAALAACAR